MAGVVLPSGQVGHAWRPVDPQMQLSGRFHDSHGICLPPYQNTLGEREPSIWAGPPEPNFHSYGGWCPGNARKPMVKAYPLPEYHSSPGTNHHSCGNWVRTVQPIYLVPAHLWYSGRGAGIYHRNRETRQKVAFGGLRAFMHDVERRRKSHWPSFPARLGGVRAQEACAILVDHV